MGWDSVSIPRHRLRCRLICRCKDWSCAEFPFLSFSHKLGVNVRKENSMSTIAFAVILLIRVILPVSILIALGEWIHRREANYWFRSWGCMETITSLLALLAGLLMRLAIPIAGTSILIYLLRKLDAHWQAEAQRLPMPAQTAECWKIKGCSPAQKKICIAASSPLPCWQVFRQPNGYLQEECISCKVFIDAPTPALKAEPRRM